MRASNCSTKSTWSDSLHFEKYSRHESRSVWNVGDGSFLRAGSYRTVAVYWNKVINSINNLCERVIDSYYNRHFLMLSMNLVGKRFMGPTFIFSDKSPTRDINNEKKKCRQPVISLPSPSNSIFFPHANFKTTIGRKIECITSIFYLTSKSTRNWWCKTHKHNHNLKAINGPFAIKRYSSRYSHNLCYTKRQAVTSHSRYLGDFIHMAFGSAMAT